MTSITIRTDQDLKDALLEKAENSGLTLSGYLKQQLWRIVQDEDIDDFVSPERWAKELDIVEKRLNDPNAEWIDARQAIKDLGKKYGL